MTITKSLFDGTDRVYDMSKERPSKPKNNNFMYIVNIEGGDPFIALNELAIYRGLDDLFDGYTAGIGKGNESIRIKYIDNINQELSIVAARTEYYK